MHRANNRANISALSKTKVLLYEYEFISMNESKYKRQYNFWTKFPFAFNIFKMHFMLILLQKSQKEDTVQS
jgi:hypothetical protein